VGCSTRPELPAEQGADEGEIDGTSALEIARSGAGEAFGTTMAPTAMRSARIAGLLTSDGRRLPRDETSNCQMLWI
jgi:hypothetical protein